MLADCDDGRFLFCMTWGVLLLSDEYPICFCRYLCLRGSYWNDNVCILNIITNDNINELLEKTFMLQVGTLWVISYVYRFKRNGLRKRSNPVDIASMCTCRDIEREQF